MSSLQKLKAKSQSTLEKFKEKAKPKTFEKKSDDRFWYPTRDEMGNGFAIIRFLPIPQVDDEKEDALAWAKIYSHSFKNEENGRWYIENSLTTFNEKDPVGELNQELWNKSEEGKKQASRQKRQLNYYSNIYVVKDPANPENEGKVFLFRYGKKIFDKILELMSPDETFGEEPVDPFNFWEGRNFRMKIKGVKNPMGGIWPNYDSSEWESMGPISDKNGNPLSDEEIEKIWESEHSLLAFYDREENFKSYDKLKERLNHVLGIEDDSSPSETKKENTKKEEISMDDDIGNDDDSGDEIDDLINDASSSSDDTDDLINEWLND